MNELRKMLETWVGFLFFVGGLAAYLFPFLILGVFETSLEGPGMMFFRAGGMLAGLVGLGLLSHHEVLNQMWLTLGKVVCYVGAAWVFVQAVVVYNNVPDLLGWAVGLVFGLLALFELLAFRR